MAGHGTRGTPVLYADATDIDRRNCKRIVPMKVLVLGLCRTGTLSVRSALRSLGYLETYHMRAASTETPRDCEMWQRAIDAKFDGEGTFDKDDWDRLLGHCQAVCDLPAAAFGQELIEAYPAAKVILTNRSVDSWFNSCAKTIDQVVQNREMAFVAQFDWAFRLYRPMLVKLWDRLFDGDFKRNGKRVYEAHYANIRKMVPKERLLEYSVEDGWEPLCRFLGEDVPPCAFPESNTIREFVQGQKLRTKEKMWRLKLHCLVGVSIVAGVVLACWCASWSDEFDIIAATCSQYLSAWKDQQ